MIDKVRSYILHRCLLQPGDRVAVAVSGGADSVALLRVLLELREDLGIVLSTAHFHHGIRGAEADRDERFVRELAGQFGLELHAGSGDVPAHARTQKASLETAARELRLQWFAALLDQGKADKIATAHTLDDQAETVLMRLLRGAGSRGLAGIFPMQKEKRLVRPFLAVSRREVENYLNVISQTWCEDSSNRDPTHTRNRVRYKLLPLLETAFSPGIRNTLADLAETARAENEYWGAQASQLLSRMVLPGKPSRSGRTASGDASQTLALDLAAFRGLPLALRRQVLYQAGEQLGISLEFKHIQELGALVDGKAGRKLSLPGGITAVRSFRELQFALSDDEETGAGAEYQYSLPVPGEVAVPEIGSTIRARLIAPGERGVEGYNSGALLDRGLLAPQLTVRNWRAGDRFLPAKTRSSRKLKELLQPGRLGQQLTMAVRKAWPVVESAGEIVWVRGFASPERFTRFSGNDHDAVLIEEIQFHFGKKQ